MHERLASPVEDVEVALSRAGVAIEPHLLAQQADKDDADTERTGQSRQVPRDAVPERTQQEPEQTRRPNIGGEKEIACERIAREVAAQSAPESPHARGADYEPCRREPERRELPGRHNQGGQEGAHLENGNDEEAAQGGDGNGNLQPRAFGEREGALAEVPGKTDAGEAGQVAQKEEVGRDAGVDTGVRGIVRLSEDMGQREQRRQPQRDSHARRPEILPQPVTLETEIADAHRDQRERRVEDGNGVGRGKRARDAAPGEDDTEFVDETEHRADENREPRPELTHACFERRRAPRGCRACGLQLYDFCAPCRRSSPHGMQPRCPLDTR